MPIHYRFAQLSDCLTVFKWRNEESVRLSSRNQALIPISQHNAWFAARVSNIQKEPILIFSCESVDVGYTRLDILDSFKGIIEVSIAITAELRNKGFGSLMMEATIEVAGTLLGAREIIATIRKGNQVSLKLFAAAGFKEFETSAEFVALRLSLSE
jgi:L-amino acid N-acyltransferase YncA